jgi:hypothetical protein
VAAILILFLFLIGRFYEMKFGQNSHYRLFLLPLACFVAAAAWYAFIPQYARGGSLRDFVGAFWPDVLLLVGGLFLVGLGYLLFRTMMGGRK